MADQRASIKRSRKKTSTINHPIDTERSLGTSNEDVRVGHGGDGPQPKLFHKVKTQRSILALVIADSQIYAGTQGGEILVGSFRPGDTAGLANSFIYQVWSLNTYELLSTISAHGGSVLSLFISSDKKLLFSGAGDAIVNVCFCVPWSESHVLRALGLVYDVVQPAVLTVLDLRRW